MTLNGKKIKNGTKINYKLLSSGTYYKKNKCGKNSKGTYAGGTMEIRLYNKAQKLYFPITGVIRVYNK